MQPQFPLTVASAIGFTLLAIMVDFKFIYTNCSKNIAFPGKKNNVRIVYVIRHGTLSLKTDNY